jgi:hypothetical protein
MPPTRSSIGSEGVGETSTSTVTSAALIVLDTLKVVVSAILMLSPERRVALTLESAKVYGSGVLLGMTMPSSTLAGAGMPGKTYSCLSGIWSKADISIWKFFAMTSGHEPANRSAKSRVLAKGARIED